MRKIFPVYITFCRIGSGKKRTEKGQTDHYLVYTIKAEAIRLQAVNGQI